MSAAALAVRRRAAADPVRPGAPCWRFRRRHDRCRALRPDADDRVGSTEYFADDTNLADPGCFDNTWSPWRDSTGVTFALYLPSDISYANLAVTEDSYVSDDGSRPASYWEETSSTLGTAAEQAAQP